MVMQGQSGEIVDGIIVEENTEGDDVYDVLGKVGKFLSTPMNTATGTALEPEKLSAKEQTAMDVVMGVLPALLRLFFRI